MVFSLFKKIFSNDKKKNNQQLWKVIEIVKETPDAVTISFQKPQGFEYKPGQFLTIEKKINGKMYRREYSFSTSPFEEKLSVTIKKIKDGQFSSFMNQQLKVDDELIVIGPKGEFTVPMNENKKIVAFSGGSGITPVMSIIKTIIHSNDNSSITLFYGNQSQDSIIFYNQLKEFQEKFPNKLKVIHVLEKSNGKYLEGIIDKSKLDQFFKNDIEINNIDEYLICGPGTMIENINNYLLNKGISAENIKYELFTPNKNLTNAAKIKGIESEITYLFEDIEEKVDYNNVDQSILDSLLDSNENIPHSCKSGVCGSCTAKLKEGSVHYNPPKVNFLSDEDYKNGYILTCCSYPKSKSITIDFNDTP